MNRRTLTTVTIATSGSALFSIAALLDKVSAPAMGGISLALCGMVLMYFMTEDNKPVPPAWQPTQPPKPTQPNSTTTTTRLQSVQPVGERTTHDAA